MIIHQAGSGLPRRFDTYSHIPHRLEFWPLVFSLKGHRHRQTILRKPLPSLGHFEQVLLGQV